MRSLSSSYLQILEYIQPVIQPEEADINISPLTTSSDIEQPQSDLFVPFLGQSNAEFMSIVYDPYRPGLTSNETSGAIILDRDLTNITGSNVITSDSPETNFAVGGSKVNGNGYYQDYNYVWWYPDENRAGGALLAAEQGLKQWLADNGAQPSDEIAIVWAQGESDVGDISPENPESKEKYKQSTIAVFDYLQNNLGYEDITFYVVPTGRVQEEAAANVGLNPQEINSINLGIELVREAQSEIALERDDVQLAPDYADLLMVYEEGQIYGESYDQTYDRWSQDIWHLGHDGLQVQGSRLAQYIALDRGENNIISFTDSFGNPAESISLRREGILDLNIDANPSQGTIAGTDNPDLIVGTQGADEVIGGAGNDVIIGALGVDTLTGGSGDDVFFYQSLGESDRILDFEPDRDRLDVSELLNSAGYGGADPIADGYIAANSLSDSSLEVLFDVDGAGAQPATSLAVLENTNVANFQTNIYDQFIFSPVEF